jgi:hypothetical protein
MAESLIDLVLDRLRAEGFLTMQRDDGEEPDSWYIGRSPPPCENRVYPALEVRDSVTEERLELWWADDSIRLEIRRVVQGVFGSEAELERRVLQ